MKKILSKEESDRIVEAIRVAEKKTSGEIRVHVENRCWGDPMKRARKVFKKLKIQKTELHNGTLIYLALKTHKFAILGDKGISEKVPENFWDDVLTEMRPVLQKGHLSEGACLGVQRVGEKLSYYFPLPEGDKNELSDEVSEG